MEVGFGKTARDNDEGVLKTQVQSFAFHPNLDIAIIILDAEVPISEHVKMISLPEAGSDYTGQIATLAGPGALGDGKPAPEELFMKVSLKVGTETGQECPSEKMLCATSLRKEPWGSGCSGDSGAPLFICSTSSDASCTLLAPITGRPNYGTQGNCRGDSDGPSVADLRPWIDEVMQGSTNVTPQKGQPMW